MLVLLVVLGRALLVYGHSVSHNPLELFNVAGTLMRKNAKTSIQVNATSFQSGDWVEVQWSGAESPALDDLVALYSPADADVREVAPVKYAWAIKSDTHLTHGQGSYRFRLVNMRASVRVVFLRSGLLAPEFETFGPILTPKNMNEPLQVHLALTGKPGEMMAQWTTLNRSIAGVRWGTQPGRYRRSALSEIKTYSREEMCGAPASTIGWLDPGIFHSALMDGLQPSTRYYYTVGDLDFGFSEEFSFVTPPPVGATSSVKFLAIADLGQAEVDSSLEPTEMLASLNTTFRLAQETAHQHLLVHLGDISYARGFGSIWDAWWDQMQPLTSKMPYMAIPGNHERDWPGSGDRFERSAAVVDSGGECGVAFERRVAMPLPGPDKFWYSFDFGPIHFLQYSTEHSFASGSEQHAFVESDLRSVDRRRTPWLIVGGHRPFLVDSTYDKNPDGDLEVSRDLQAAFEELFKRHAVDMTWHGHHHSYQRSCAVFKNECVEPNADGSQNAPIHLVIGHAGAGLSFTVQFEKPSIFEVVKVEHGYMRVEANGTNLLCEVISSSDGSLMDRVELHKPEGWGTAFHEKQMLQQHSY